MKRSLTFWGIVFLVVFGVLDSACAETFAPGETSWGVAQSLGISLDQFLELNPEIEASEWAKEKHKKYPETGPGDWIKMGQSYRSKPATPLPSPEVEEKIKQLSSENNELKTGQVAIIAQLEELTKTINKQGEDIQALKTKLVGYQQQQPIAKEGSFFAGTSFTDFVALAIGISLLIFFWQPGKLRALAFSASRRTTSVVLPLRTAARVEQYKSSKNIPFLPAGAWAVIAAITFIFLILLYLFFPGFG